jgi:excisionase family DNA binding protein
MRLKMNMMPSQWAEPAATSQSAEPYIDKLEVGRRMTVRPRTVDQWMKQGRRPYYKFGRAVRFKWSEVEAHLARTFLVARKGRER